MNFTDRENEVIAEVLKGKTNVECGEKLCICENTVKFHLTSIFKKAKVKSRAQLMVKMINKPEAA